MKLKSAEFFNKVKERDWKKVARTGALLGVLSVGNAIGIEAIRGAFDKENSRIAVLNQRVQDQDFGLCLSLKGQDPTTTQEEDQAFCQQWLRTRSSRYDLDDPDPDIFNH